MRVILGIGNPGKKYEFTRHNAGFLLLDQFANKNRLSFKTGKGEYYYCEGTFAGKDFVLVKPTTYVNNSGIAAKEILAKYSVPVEDLLVVHDELNLETGIVKLKGNGGDGGHNGISSIIYHLNSNVFPRLRIGIGASFGKGQMADYVLSEFHRDEEKVVEDVFNTSLHFVEEFIRGGYKGMIDYNSKIKKAAADKEKKEKEKE